MILSGTSDTNRRRLQVRRSHGLAVALAIFIFAAAAPNSQAQLPQAAVKLPTKTEPTVRVDPLERETPHSMMMGFLKYALLEDYEIAGRYLQPVPGMNLEQRVKELRALHQRFTGDIALLTDDPNGIVENGLPLGRSTCRRVRNRRHDLGRYPGAGE